MPSIEKVMHYDSSSTPIETRIEQSLAKEASLAFLKDFLVEFPQASIYLVGGGNRDALLGKQNKDFDFVIRGLKPEIIEKWFEAKGEIQLVGRNFGVYKFVPTGFSLKDIEYIDIALPRSEQAIEGGMGGTRDFDVQVQPDLPIESDLSRRDFTWNAMAFDVRNKKLIDPFHGQEDLKNRLIRAVLDPHKRFGEDLSRMLRAIRISAQLGFDIEEKTLQAIKDLMPTINKQRPRADGKSHEFVVPRETITKEFLRALTLDPRKTTALFHETGAFNMLFPAVARAQQNNPEYLRLIEKAPATKDPTVSLCLLFRGLTGDEAEKNIKDLCLQAIPSDSKYRIEADYVINIVRTLEKAKEEPSSLWPTQASEFEKMYMNPRGDRLISVLTTIGYTDAVKDITERLARYEKNMTIKHGEKIPHHISGNTIRTDLGYKPGPLIRLVINAMRDLQLDIPIISAEKAKAILQKMLPLQLEKKSYEEAQILLQEFVETIKEQESRK